MTQSLMAENKRLQVPALGEWYDDLLYIDAWINGRSKVLQAQNLLCAKLQERETRIKERIDYLAEKRKISSKELWLQILAGKAERLSPEESFEVSNPNGDANQDEQ